MPRSRSCRSLDNVDDYTPFWLVCQYLFSHFSDFFVESAIPSVAFPGILMKESSQGTSRSRRKMSNFKKAVKFPVVRLTTASKPPIIRYKAKKERVAPSSHPPESRDRCKPAERAARTWLRSSAGELLSLRRAVPLQAVPMSVGHEKQAGWYRVSPRPSQ